MVIRGETSQFQGFSFKITLTALHPKLPKNDDTNDDAASLRIDHDTKSPMQSEGSESMFDDDTSWSDHL